MPLVVLVNLINEGVKIGDVEDLLSVSTDDGCPVSDLVVCDVLKYEVLWRLRVCAVDHV